MALLSAEARVVSSVKGRAHRVSHEPSFLVRQEIIIALEIFTRPEKHLRFVQDDPLKL